MTAIKPALKQPIIDLLTTEGPLTTTQIANRLGCTSCGAGYAMRHAPNDFYVSAWTENFKQIWAVGKGNHAPRPKRTKFKECKTQREQWRKNGILREEARLTGGYITSARLPWELTPCPQ